MASVNMTMLVAGRYDLTSQALASLEATVEPDVSITIVDDCSDIVTKGVVEAFRRSTKMPCHIVTVGPDSTEHARLGRLRNLAVAKATEQFGVATWLYVSDNDVRFKSGWLTVLLAARALFPAYRVLGGYNHPFQQPLGETYPFQTEDGLDYVVREYAAVGTLSWLLRTADWQPLLTSGSGTNASEDWALCQDVRRRGYKVGAVWPHVIDNLGVVGTDGRRCPGAEYVETALAASMEAT